MSERIMEIMNLYKDEVQDHLISRGYGDFEKKWLDEKWEDLCEYGESHALTPYVKLLGLLNHLTSKISRENGKNRYHCHIQDIIWFSVKDMIMLSGEQEGDTKLYNVETNPIPKETLFRRLHEVETWEYHLSHRFKNEKSTFSYLPGSVTLEDHGSSLSVQFVVYQKGGKSYELCE